jgi:nucleoside-diphosphate-sugar epimerase
MLNRLAGDLDHILAHTAGIWDEFRGARIFVTGGTGFIGSWLLESFVWAQDRLQLDASMTVLTRSPEAFRTKAPHLAAHPAIEMQQGDVRSFAFPEGRFSHVIHAATEASAKLIREQPLLMLDTIIDGTRRALDFAAASGVRRFLLLSSGAVYGTQPPAITHIPETYEGAPDPHEPRWVYGEGKRVAELLGSVYAQTHGLSFLIARCFAFVGPYLPLDTHFAIGNFILDCMKERSIEIRGDGTPYRSYLYAADLAVWLWTILARGDSCRAYNVGSEQCLTIADLGRVVCAALGSCSEIKVASEPRRGNPSERYVPGTLRARRELGLQESVPLEDAIRRTAAWYSCRTNQQPPVVTGTAPI